MANAYRDHYLAIADRANDPEGWTEDYPVELPMDLPDDHGTWDWPDAPDPRVNDIDRHFAWGWLATCAAISLGSLIYLVQQV